MIPDRAVLVPDWTEADCFERYEWNPDGRKKVSLSATHDDAVSVTLVVTVMFHVQISDYY